MGMDWATSPEEIQGGTAWKKWRELGIGASEAPIIMGVSKWRTPYQHWLERTGQIAPSDTNFAQSMGHRREPIARRKYEEKTGLKFGPKIFERGILKASLDGWNEELKAAIEIKCPGIEDHLTAKAGTVPEHYYWQLAHQFLVTDPVYIDYISYYVAKDVDENEGELVVVRMERPSNVALTLYEAAAACFWDLIETNTPPAMTERDYHPVTEESLKKLIQKYTAIQAESNVIEQRLKNAKDEIIEWVSGKGFEKVVCDNAKIYKVTRQGNIDYSKVKELGSVDLEKYRKPASSHYRIDVP